MSQAGAADDDERFARQILLPGVGSEGQARWRASRVPLAGDGIALQAARTALLSSGASILPLQDPRSLPEDEASIPVLVLAPDPAQRRGWSRELRRRSRSVLFAWPSAGGFALALFRHVKGACPCLECYESLNPKAFEKGDPGILRALAAAAASEALLGILGKSSPLDGKVSVFPIGSGNSFRHPVTPSMKCPASLREAGAGVTP